MTKFYGNEKNVDTGILLEDIYRKKLMDKLVGSESVKKELSDRIVGDPEKNSDMDGLLKKPAFEELGRIPLNDQLRLMNEHFKALPKDQEIDPDMDKRIESIRKLQLIKGQRVG